MISNRGKSTNIFQKKEDIVSRDIAGETILVPIRGKLADMQRIFAMNPVAKYIWEHINGELMLDDIRIGIMKVFDVGEGQAKEDLYKFIDELLMADLIVEVKK